MPRPIILGVVGDSAAGKTTITRGLVRLLGDEHVTHIAADDYHRFDRRQRAERGSRPCTPTATTSTSWSRTSGTCARDGPILKPVYRHKDGTFGPAEYVEPRQFTVVEGLLGYHTQTLRESFDVRVFLAPPEDLRRHWKVQRDCSRRGYTSDQVLEELDRRGPIRRPISAPSSAGRTSSSPSRRAIAATRTTSTPTSRCVTASVTPT